MAEAPTLASSRFRSQRQERWRQLEALVARAERTGLSSLQAEELLSLPLLYRACASSLAVARGISLDANLIDYLESLVTRAYFVVYGARATLASLLARFVGREFPAAVRSAWRPLALAGALLFGGVGAGWAITASDSAWFDAFVSAGMANERTPAASRETLEKTLFDKPPAVESLTAFASFLFQNNAGVGMLCFALGAAFGAPVVLLLFHNGLMLGAMCAVFANRDLTVEFLGWLAIHGTTEITAVLVCGAAGFRLAAAMIDPGRRSRLAALAARGREAAVLVIGAVAMFFVAAMLEGFGRQLVDSTALRFGVGGFMLAAWVAYFALAGRAGPRRGR